MTRMQINYKFILKIIYRYILRCQATFSAFHKFIPLKLQPNRPAESSFAKASAYRTKRDIDNDYAIDYTAGQNRKDTGIVSESIKAVGMLSGGLDSTLAAHIMKKWA